MAVINTGLLTKGLKSEFFNRFEGTKTHFQDLATRIPSTSDSETYRWLGTVPQIREWGADSRQLSVSVAWRRLCGSAYRLARRRRAPPKQPVLVHILHDHQR